MVCVCVQSGMGWDHDGLLAMEQLVRYGHWDRGRPRAGLSVPGTGAGSLGKVVGTSYLTTCCPSIYVSMLAAPAPAPVHRCLPVRVCGLPGPVSCPRLMPGLGILGHVDGRFWLAVDRCHPLPPADSFGGAFGSGSPALCRCTYLTSCQGSPILRTGLGASY